jgi:hypothetical protein
MPGLTCHFQYTVEREAMLMTPEFAQGLREAVMRHNVSLPHRIDALVLFDEPRAASAGY